MKSYLLSAAALFVGASSASAAISVDGVLDAAYGAPTYQVAYDPNTPGGFFGGPAVGTSTNAAYNIYGKVANDTFYGFWLAKPNGVGPNAPFSGVNVYFDTNGNSTLGADIGFEVGNDRAFRPGVFTGGPNNDGYSAKLNLEFFATQNSFEFAIPLAMLRNGIPSLPNYGAAQLLPKGGKLTITISQAFGHDVVRDPLAGPTRLGQFATPVPEPASWAMMIGGFVAVGGALRRRARSTVVYA
jgi:hypothetical protein